MVRAILFAMVSKTPWREERRLELKKQFFATLALTALAAIFTLVVADRVINSQINGQNNRNLYLQKNIATLDAQVAEIRDLQRKRSQLIERMRVIQELQGNRPVIVRIIDQLVRTLPDGVFYMDLVTREDEIAVQGIAESNNRVSSLMRRLEASDWLEQPNLDAVRAAPEYGEQATTFNLSVSVQLPDSDEGV